MIKKLLLNIIFHTICSCNLYCQCLSKDYSTEVFFEIKKGFDFKKYDTIKSNTESKINYELKDDNGKPSAKGTLIIIKKNNAIELYQIGYWIRYDNGEILGRYKFDSCGFCYHEEYYEKNDTNKTSEVTRSFLNYNNKKYEAEIIQNYGVENTYDSFIIVNGKRIHHGFSRSTINEVVTYEREYEFGKIKK